MRTSTNTFAKRSIRAAVLVGLLGCGLAGAQEYPPDLKAALIASPESANTIELKDARVLTYRELVELPASERLELLKLSKERMPRIRFSEWQLGTAEALADEAKKLRDIAEAESAEARARHVKVREEFAEKVRQLIAIGKKVPPEVKRGVELDLQRQYIIDGLKPETLSFLKSLLARPELFDDKWTVP